MMTTEELLKLKTDYAAWFEPGDEMDLSEVANDMTKLVDELLATRQRAETAEITLTLLRQALDADLQVHLMPSGPDYTVEIVGDDKGIGPYVQGFAVESTFSDALNSALKQLSRYFRA